MTVQRSSSGKHTHSCLVVSGRSLQLVADAPPHRVGERLEHGVEIVVG